VRLRAGYPEKRLILMIRLVVMCAGSDTSGGPQAEKGATSDPPKSEDGEGRGGCKEPLTRRRIGDRASQGTSDTQVAKDPRPGGGSEPSTS